MPIQYMPREMLKQFKPVQLIHSDIPRCDFCGTIFKRDDPEFTVTQPEVSAHARIYMGIIHRNLLTPEQRRDVELLCVLLHTARGGICVSSETHEAVVSVTNWTICDRCHTEWETEIAKRP